MGKFSIIDLTIVLLIIIGVSVLFIKNSTFGKARLGTPCTINYSVEIKSVRDFTKNGIKQGDNAFDSKGAFIGKIIDVASKPAEGEIRKVDGTSVLAAKPDRYDLVVTLEVNGVDSDAGVMVEGLKSIYKGGGMVLSVKDVTCESQIKDIKILGKK